MRVLLAASLMLSVALVSEDTARADEGQLYHITVERAAVAPTKPNGRNWDTTPVESGPSSEDEAQAKLIAAAAKELVKKALEAGTSTPVGLLLSVGEMAGKYGLAQLGNAIAYPDATGQLYVDGRLVITLDLAKDTYSPVWANESAPLLLAGKERIRLLLIAKTASRVMTNWASAR